MEGISHPEQPTVPDFADRLLTTGLRGALEFLNGRTRHRFTGVYRFEEPMLRCHCLFDRENPTTTTGADLMLRDSYCGVVAESEHFFEIENALDDPRLDGHPARESVLAYQGVPLQAPEGSKCIGSLCHWDVRPRLIAKNELIFLFAIAPLIAGTLEPTRTPDARAPSINPPSGRR